MMKVAVIGVGSMGQNHARIYSQREDVQLVGIADVDRERAEKIAKRYNTRAYHDYLEMLEGEDIDAISIAVPTSLHREVALAALRHGKHVLLEKPIARTEAEAEEIIRCARENGAKLMIGHIERFNPAVIDLKERLQRGELGDVYKIDVQRIGPFPARITDVGVVIDLSVHDLDVIGYLLNVGPSRVYAEIQQKLHPMHEDSLTALVRYQNDVLAVLNVNFISPAKIRQLRIFGKKGMFQVNYLQQELYFYENPGFSSESWDSVVEGDVKKIHLLEREPLHAEIEAFLNCIENDLPSPVPGEDGLAVLKLAHLLLHSARQRKIIEMDVETFSPRRTIL